MQPYLNVNIPCESPNTFYRVFESQVEDEELVWHRDHNDRICYVVEGCDWSIQFDNKMPVKLREGDVFRVTKYDYHRLIKGATRLVLKIEELIDGQI